MTQRVYSQSKDHITSQPASRVQGLYSYTDYGIVLGLISLVLFAQILMFPTRIIGDVAMYVDIGARILDGQLPYVDFREINLPVVHYLNTIPAFLSRTFSINPSTSALIFVWVFIVICALAMLIALRDRRSSWKPGEIYLLPVLTLIYSQTQFRFQTYGQREHFFIAVALLWLLVRWRRWEGVRHHPAFAFVTGVIVTIAVSLKPHFVPIILVVELWGWLRWRSARSLFCPEIVGALFVASVYGLYLAAFPQVMPTYIHDVLPLIVTGYNGYGYIPPFTLLTNDLRTVLQLLLCLIPWLWRGNAQGSLWSLARPVSLLTLSSALVFAVQTKGWEYHRLPFDFFSLVLVSLIVPRLMTIDLGMAQIRTQKISHVLCAVAATVYVAMTLSDSALMSFSPLSASDPVLTDAVKRYTQPGDNVIVIDENLQPFWPAVHQAQVHQVLRYLPSYVFPLAYYDVPREALYSPAHQPPESIERYLNAVEEDIRQFQPLLIVIRTNASDYARESNVDLYRFLTARGFLRNIVQPTYDFAEEVVGYRFYVHRGPASG